MMDLSGYVNTLGTFVYLYSSEYFFHVFVRVGVRGSIGRAVRVTSSIQIK